MTEPGYVTPPAAGWWERTDRIGTTESAVEFDSTVAGLAPDYYYKPPFRIPNPSVGPQALRKKFQRRPPSLKRIVSVAFDAVGDNYQYASTATSKTWTHVLGSTANAIVVYATTWAANIRMSAKVGSTPMIPFGVSQYRITTSVLTLHAFILQNPPTGSQTITIAPSADVQCAAASMSYTNVGGFGEPVNNFGAGTTANTSGTVVSSYRDIVSHAFTSANTASGAYSSYNQTTRKSYNATGGTEPFIAGDAVGSPTLAFSATAPINNAFLSAAIPLLADAITGGPVCDSVADGYQANSASPSWTHVLTADAKAIVVAIQIWVNANPPTVTASIGATSLTQLGSNTNIYTTSGYYLHQYLFGMINPPTGSQTISISTTGGTSWQTSGTSIAYQKVSSFGSVTTAAVAGTAATMDVTSASNQRVLQAFTCANVGSGCFTGYTGAARFAADAGGGTEPHIIGDKPGAASVNFSATGVGSKWGGIAIPLIP